MSMRHNCSNTTGYYCNQIDGNCKENIFFGEPFIKSDQNAIDLKAN